MASREHDFTVWCEGGGDDLQVAMRTMARWFGGKVKSEGHELRYPTRRYMTASFDNYLYGEMWRDASKLAVKNLHGTVIEVNDAAR